MSQLPPLRWREYRNELDRIVRDGHVPGEAHPATFSQLATEFSRLRANSKKKLDGLLRDLQKDRNNPAFLSVSLLRLLDGTGLRETAHTRLLAWLLNPAHADSSSPSSHGLPADLFGSVVDWARRENKNVWPMGPCSVKSVCAEKYITKRKRIDIWIEGELITADGTWEWLTVVEAKLRHHVTRGQLKHYRDEADAWRKKNPKKRLQPWFIYLKDGSPVGDEDPHGVWKPLGFVDLFEIIWRRIATCEDAHGYQLARHYLAGILSDIEGWTLPLRVKADGLDYQMIDFCKRVASRDDRKEWR